MDPVFVHKHIRSLAAAPDRFHSPVIDRVIADCWPGGTADRSDPVALEWVRRWQPTRADATLPLCACWAGRCAVCN